MPPATAGVERGPLPNSSTNFASSGVRQTSLPVASSRQSAVSWSPSAAMV